MAQEMELADVFLRHSHPTEEGWVCRKNLDFNGVKVEYAYQREDVIQLISVNMQDPFVSKKEIERAIAIQDASKALHPTAIIKIILVYSRLLMNPHYLPKDISVVSIMEEGNAQQPKFSKS
ncbi:MAG: hypothetical protein ACI9CU_001150 [Polaribacter sp.]|jgi:hypothetical protein